MLTAIFSVPSLLLAIFTLMAGSSFLATLVSLRLDAGGSHALMIGIVGTGYFAGLTVGARRVTALIGRVGHIRTFAAVASLLSATALAFPIVPPGLGWAALRFLNGIAMAGVFICLESWLNERAEASTRGSVLAGYMLALYSGQALGQILLTLDMADQAMPFAMAAMLVSLAAIPVALTRIASPEIFDATPLKVVELYHVSPLGCIGTIVTGLMFGSFYALGAVYVLRQGGSVDDAAWFMTAVILGGVALQFPLGRLSDRFDRRKVIIALFGGTILSSLALALAGLSGAASLALGMAFGGLGFALYPLCVAHTNDHLKPEQRVGASGGLVLIYSLGAAVGPFVAGGAMETFGPSGLFLFLAGCAAITFGFGLWREWRTDSIPEALQQDFQVLPRTTPVAASLDPYAEEGEADA